MRSLPFGLSGPDAFCVSANQYDTRRAAPPKKRGRKPTTPEIPTGRGPGLREWMKETYAEPGFSKAARELREENRRRRDAAQINRPTRVA